MVDTPISTLTNERGDEATRSKLEGYLRENCNSDVRVEAITKLTGGAIQQNWKIAVTVPEGRGDWKTGSYVLRMDAPSVVAASLNRSAEFAVLKQANALGVPCPIPLHICESNGVLGKPFFIMTWARGVATPHKLVKDDLLVPDRSKLVGQIGEAMAALHRLTPGKSAIPLSDPTTRPTIDLIGRLQTYLDTQPICHPALEWGLRFCEINAPTRESSVFVHRDLRTGNYLVDHGELSAILDWEFAAWANPLEDLGWFTARCWRFGATDREAGGVGDLESFLEGYAKVSGKKVDSKDLIYWQLLAHLRWAVIALQQADRHNSGNERSLELALTGRVIPELEQEILRLTEAM